jgi:hypothetical protein
MITEEPLLSPKFSTIAVNSLSADINNSLIAIIITT